MRTLFDRCTPRPLRGYLTSHVVNTSYDKGWSELDNGALLDKAEQHGYEVFVTTDADMADQRVLTGRELAVVVLLSNQWPLIRQAAESGQIQNAVENTGVGAVSIVPIPLS